MTPRADRDREQPATIEPEPSAAELMAVVLSRELVDEERGILGAASHIHAAAVRLAQLRQAPSLWWISGPSGVVNGHSSELVSVAEFRALHGAEALTALSENVDMIDWRHRYFDYAFLGGMQIDQFGSLNTVCIGPWEKPKVRGPGTIGAAALAAYCGRFFVVMQPHTRSSFVQAVDFVSAAGHRPGGVAREHWGLPGDGPALVVSPLGVFDFATADRRMRVRSLHPGVDRQRVEQATGFALEWSDPVAATTLPDAEELALLRTEVDPTGRLRQ